MYSTKNSKPAKANINERKAQAPEVKYFASLSTCLTINIGAAGSNLSAVFSNTNRKFSRASASPGFNFSAFRYAATL